jgi:hypothetical protein
VTRKSTATAIVIGVLTLVGFVLVANLVGGRRADTSSAATQARPTPAAKAPQVSMSPLPPAAKPPQADGQLHSDLASAQVLIDQLSTAIAAANWSGAHDIFVEFQRKTESLPAPQLAHPDISPLLQDFFSFYEVELERALAAQDAWHASSSLNQLSGILADERVRIGSRGMPPEYPRLRFLVREVELWSQASDERMLRVRAVALRDAWRDLKPIIARRNGVEPAKNFQALVDKLSGAAQIQDVAALAPDFNKALDQMDSLFRRQPKPAGTGQSISQAVDEE